jgi:hypothetical protein
MSWNQGRALRGSLALALAAIAGLATAGSAMAAEKGPEGQSFYTPPATLPSVHGTLIRYRPATMKFSIFAPASKAWTVMYRSESVEGKADAVTGTVIVPTSLWLSTKPRPVVDLAVGTQGLSQKSAPSEQFVGSGDYEDGSVEDALKKGYIVEVTDYAGYTNGGTPDYIVGESEGHAVLDIAKAATEIPGAGVSPSAEAAIWGYSQGGGASAWAAQLWPTYLPSLDLVADAAGGIPSELDAVAEYLNGSIGFPFLLYSVIGLNQDYPSQVNLSTYTNAAGKAAIKKLEEEGLVEALGGYAFKNLDEYTVNKETLAQLLAVPSIKEVIGKQLLGRTPITVPLYQYHAMIDEIVPKAQDEQLRYTYCKEGVKDYWTEVFGEHALGDFEAAEGAVNWIEEMINGKKVKDNCPT